VAEGLDHEYADVLEDPWVFQHVGFFLVQRSKPETVAGPALAQRHLDQLLD
jgi:hypothetical protein